MLRTLSLLSERTRSSPWICSVVCNTAAFCSQLTGLVIPSRSRPLCHCSRSKFTGFVLTVFFSSPVTFTITSALSSKFSIYFLNTTFPSCTDHPHMTSDPVARILFKRPLMPFIVMVVGFLSLVLSAQLMTSIPTLILNLFSSWSLS